jgi:hypothetical protein
MSTDISENGLATPIMRHLTGGDGLAVVLGVVTEGAPPYGCAGYVAR